MADPIHQDPGERLREQHRREGDLDRRLHVEPRIESRREDLHQDEAEQADAVAEQRIARLDHVVHRELAVLIERRDHRRCEHPQRDRRRQREQEREPQAPVEQRRVFRGILVGVMLRERRQEHGAERDAEERARKFHQPIRVRDPRNAAIAQHGRELGVDQRRDLRRGHADDRRTHRQQHAPHARVAPVEARPRKHADRDERANLQQRAARRRRSARPRRAP